MNRRIAIIPARANSKRIPKKNIKDFCGRPIISYVIEAALESGLFDEIHVSTDCHEIADLVISLGVGAHFLRPTHLADDHTPIMPVLKFVLDTYLRQGCKFDNVAMLMACAPMITVSDLTSAAALFDAHHGKRAVIGVSEYPCPIEWAFRRQSNGVLVPMQPGMFSVRSQDLAKAYYDAGQFCFMSSERVFSAVDAGSDQNFIGFPIQRHQAIDIDTLDDWRFAELLFRSIEQHVERD